MKRFVIRNYGLTRQIPYKKKQIYIGSDQAIETDDEGLVAVLEKYKDLHVVDRGSEPVLAPPVSTSGEVPSTSEASEEIDYKEMSHKELQALGKDRQIKVVGVGKGKLIKALEKYDKAEVPEEVAV